MDLKSKAKHRLALWLILSACLLAQATVGVAGNGILQIRNGYFWDPSTQDYFVARGIAYQTWNPPVGADQTFDQVEYDLTEFKKMGANSVRAEFVWNTVEPTNDVFDWSKPDFLVAKAEELGLKLFILIGFQYAPDWFPTEWKAVNDHGSNSVVLAYENPDARRAYTNFIHEATTRYKDSSAIGCWIMGNEYAYFDLWDTDRRYLGFDPYSQASFRSYLSNLYAGDIVALNLNWKTNFASFNAVIMPTGYPTNRIHPGLHDLLQWRKKSIGDYVAFGAVAARQADPNHLMTYSMVGGIFSGNDALFTCEDARTIVARCAAAGAPLQFWSINNYALASMGNELRSADFGVGKYQAESGLPVMISETGHSSTEISFLGDGTRQAKALPSQIWESLASGAIGTHVFHWSDRDLFNGFFIREKGFGIVNQDRTPKSPVYQNVVDMFRQMQNIRLDQLFGGSSNPPPDVQFFWSTNADMGWPRANQENCMLWSALKRQGFQPGLIFDKQFDQGAYTNAPALVLSRCFMMSPKHLGAISSNVIPAGIHVHANADLPGQFDAYNRTNANWVSLMSSLFGLGVAGAVPDYDQGVFNVDYNGTVNFTGAGTLGAFTPGYADHLGTWKVWRGITALSGATIVRHTGNNGTQPFQPALQIKTNGAARTAINTFALGDTFGGTPSPSPVHQWEIRTDWLRSIYQNHFGLKPVMNLTGTGATYVTPDYRRCRNGSLLISLLNEHTNAATVTLTSTNLLLGRTVENLTSGGIVETNSDGIVVVTVPGDTLVLLYAYTSSGGQDESLINASRNKLWFQDAPSAVWPSGTNYNVTVAYDTKATNLSLFVSLERAGATNKVYGQSSPLLVGGRTHAVVGVPVPDPDLNDIQYISSRDGARYVFHAWLETNGVKSSECFLPVRLLWAVRPVSLPAAITPGSTYPVTVEWEELPSYEASLTPLPLSRADRWEPLLRQFENYNVVLLLQSAGQVVASNSFLTSTGTDSHQFSVNVPANATGPFTWTAYLETSPGASDDILESFENRSTGDDPALFGPWLSYVYSQNGTAQSFAQGVHGLASDGKQVHGLASDGKLAVFMVITNPASSGAFSGFGLRYVFKRAWSLPHDFSQWTHYTFSFDLREASGHPCILEMQLKDVRGGRIEFTKPYTPGVNFWDTARATLDRFVVSPPVGFFDWTQISEMVVNIRTDGQPNFTFITSIDNIRLDGPDRVRPWPGARDVIDNFDNRTPGASEAFLLPWVGYAYAESNNVSLLALGVNNGGVGGGQAAFIVAANPTNPGNFSGFGMTYTFPVPWALPADTNQWTNYVFSFDFKEASSFPCVMEMQVKSASDRWLEFTKIYTPGPNQFDTVRATLDQFVLPPGVGPFDPSHIESIVVNIRNLRTNAIYVGQFDNIFFTGPPTANPNAVLAATYTSANDALLDSDHDGIPDVTEISLGTNPFNPDTDGDGMTDGAELVAGTNPNSLSDVLRIQSLVPNGLGGMTLTWPAKAGRLYTVQCFDGHLVPGARFIPAGALTNLAAPGDGPMQATDPAAPAQRQRTYRITVRTP